MSRLLALDQASHTSGYAIYVDSKLTSHGKFTFNDSDQGVRLNKIRNKVKSLIEENKIDEVIFEDIQLQTSHSNNVQTFKILAEVFGVIYELVTEMGIPNEAVLAVQWKSALKIKGTHRAEQKKNAQNWVFNTYGIRPTEDECDAICIGAYRFHKPDPIFDWS